MTDLEEVRMRLNYYRRVERQIIKRMQKMCNHKRVKCFVRHAPLPYGYGLAMTGYANTYAKCVDCGKIMK